MSACARRGMRLRRCNARCRMMASQYPQKLTAENRQGRHLQPFAVSRPLQINHLRRENLRRGSRIGELGLGEIKPKIPEHDRSFSGPAREGYEAPPDNVRPVGVVRARPHE